MEITIKRYSRKLTYEDAATLDEFWELAKRTERSLDREQRRHWDGRECDEYIIAAQPVMIKKIGKNTYRVKIHFSETSKEAGPCPPGGFFQFPLL